MPTPRPLRLILPAAEARALAEKGLQQRLNPKDYRALREAVDLRQVEAARRLATHRDTIRAWERDRWDKGHREPSRELRVKLCTLVLGMLDDPHARPVDVVLRPAA